MATPPGSGIVAMDLLLHPRTQDQKLHPMQELLPAGLALLVLILKIRERYLNHNLAPPNEDA